jgi:streptogramin lyase
VEYALPTAKAGPVGIAAGPNGAVWFVDIMADRIGRIATTGQITEYPLRISGARPHAITAAVEGALCFTQWGSNYIGRITVTGEVSEYAIPTPGSEPHGIAAGQTTRYGLRRKRARSDASSRHEIRSTRPNPAGGRDLGHTRVVVKGAPASCRSS